MNRHKPNQKRYHAADYLSDPGASEAHVTEVLRLTTGENALAAVTHQWQRL